MSFKPLLSPNDCPLKNPNFFDFIPFPCMVSPKLDGVRGVVKEGRVKSRTYKDIPSKQVQELFSDYAHFDGELMEGDWKDSKVYNRTQGHVMSNDKPGDMTFHVFDFTHPTWLVRPYISRYDQLEDMVKTINDPRLILVKHDIVDDMKQLLDYEQWALEQGYEGIMIRDPIAGYKNGRATMRQSIIFKLKRFMDAEGLVIGFVQGEENHNEEEKDELGYAKRSDKKEGRVQVDRLGKFIVNYLGNEISVAPGSLTHKERDYIWNNRDQFYDRMLKFRFFNHGVKDKPRFPRFIGWRDKIDMGE